MNKVLEGLAIVAISGASVAVLSLAGLLVMDLVRSIKRYREGYYN